MQQSGKRNKIVILSGAGLSAESGLGTFRDKDGLWTKFDLNEVATPGGFERNPSAVHEFYNLRRSLQINAKPNAAHFALARLEQEYNGDVITVTQNIDQLHEQAGSRNIIHMHGEINKAKCAHCGHREPWFEDLSTDLVCKNCRKPEGMRPDVVWFGEMPYFMDEIFHHLSKCTTFLSIGTSGTVYPAAGFVSEANRSGAHSVELNLEPSEGVSEFSEVIHGKATEIVPAFVDRFLKT